MNDDARCPANEPDGTSFPMSFAQRRLWFLHQLDPSGFAQGAGRCFTVSGPVDVDALQSAVDTLVARHEPLRTSFPTVPQLGPQQWVAKAASVRIRVIDLPAALIDEAEAMRRVRELIEEPYDIERGPLLRMSLLRRAPHTYRLVVCLHLLAADGWAQAVLNRELGALYRAAVTGESPALPVLAIQYADWAAWQTAQLTAQRRAALARWWRDELRDTPLTLDLAGAAGTRARSPRPGVRIHRPLPAETAAAVNSVARQGRHTVFSVLVAACGVVLRRYGRRDKLLLGLAVANRERPEVDNLLGFFVNTVALTIDLTGDPTFSELVGRVGLRTVAVHQHQDLPFDHLVAELNPPRDPRRSPIVQTNIAYHPAGSVGILSLHGCVVTEELLDAGPARFELTFRIEETADHQTVLWAEFDSDLLDPALVDRLIVSYVDTLGWASESPDTPISQLMAPSTPTEEALARDVAGVLGRANVDIHDNFFALGGHSLQLSHLAGRIRARTGQEISVRDLYQASTLADIAAQIDEQHHEPIDEQTHEQRRTP